MTYKKIIALFCISLPLLTLGQTGVYVQNGKSIEDVKETMRYMSNEVVYNKQEVIDTIYNGKPLYVLTLYYQNRKTGHPIKYSFNKQKVCYLTEIPIDPKEEDLIIKEFDKNLNRIESKPEYTDWTWGYGTVAILRYLKKPYYTLQYMGGSNG